MDKIFSSQNRLKGINLLKNLKMDKDLDLEIPDDVVDSINPLGIWAQLKVSGDYSFTKEETDIIDKIKSIISYGIIDNMVLYEYGLYPSIIASDILGLNRKYISDIYKNMPIYSVKDIKINGDEIINILGIEPGSIIKDIILDIELNILNGTLENDFSKIKEYILKNWR